MYIFLEGIFMRINRSLRLKTQKSKRIEDRLMFFSCFHTIYGHKEKLQNGARNVCKVINKDDQQSLSHGCGLCSLQSISAHWLFVKEDSNDDADDEDHSQDRSDHPDEPVACVQGLGVWVWGDHRVCVGAGHIHFLYTYKQTNTNSENPCKILGVFF